MARPKNQTDLLALGQQNFDRLMDLIEQMDADQQEKAFPKGTLNRNISDVLMHLHHWHLMMLQWYEVGMAGDKPEMPAKGYTWKTTPALNQWIREKYQDVPLAEAKKSLRKSHQAVRKLIQKHTDMELFEKKKYKWTGSTSLGAYLVSATSSHYDWASRLIHRVKK